MPVKSLLPSMQTGDTCHMKTEDLVFVVLSKLQNSQNIAQKITASLLFFL